jgi:hypothetical protein
MYIVNIRTLDAQLFCCKTDAVLEAATPQRGKKITVKK